MYEIDKIINFIGADPILYWQTTEPFQEGGCRFDFSETTEGADPMFLYEQDPAEPLKYEKDVEVEYIFHNASSYTRSFANIIKDVHIWWWNS